MTSNNCQHSHWIEQPGGYYSVGGGTTFGISTITVKRRATYRCAYCGKYREERDHTTTRSRVTERMTPYGGVIEELELIEVINYDN